MIEISCRYYPEYNCSHPTEECGFFCPLYEDHIADGCGIQTFSGDDE